MPKVKFDLYPKMKSANVTYGQKVYLDDSLRQEDTIFAESTPVCVLKIESLRNEIIHNGSLDSHYNLYHGAKDGEIDHWIFAPTFNENGTLVNLKGRKKFYSDYNNTFNTILPQLISDVVDILQSTIKLLIMKFDCPATDNPHEIMNYKREIAQWAGLMMDESGYLSLPESLIEFASKGKSKN